MKSLDIPMVRLLLRAVAFLGSFNWRRVWWAAPLVMFLGCGGGNGANSSGSADIVFESSRALDGSNAPNTTCQILTNSGNVTEVASNLWVISADGSGARPLTHLTVCPAGTGPGIWAPDGSKIVYQSAPNLSVVNVDGSGTAALTSYTASEAFAQHPVWSPDSRSIAFSSDGAFDGSNATNATPFDENIWVMKADGSGRLPITRLDVPGTSLVSPAWSSDSAKVAFLSNGALDGSDAVISNAFLDSLNFHNLWVANADGSGLTPLTRLTGSVNATVRDFAWLPGSNKIVYSSDRALDGTIAAGSGFNLWVVNADGTGAMPLTRLTASNSGGTVMPSPDGSKIAFTSTRAVDGSDTLNTNANDNIWVINADGTNPTPLTKLTACSTDVLSPSPEELFLSGWSPQGGKVAFFSNRALDGSNACPLGFHGNPWVVNADGTGAVPLTKYTNAFATIDILIAGSWSHDGTKLLVVSDGNLDGTDTRAGVQNLWTVNPDGSGLTPITKLTAPNSDTFADAFWRP